MELKKEFVDIAYKILTRRENNAFTDMDLYVISSIQRLIKLHEGFETLIEKQNYEAAIPLLRLMLDTCMRLIAVGLSSAPQEVINAFFSDKNISKIKSIEGKPLSDGYLKDKLETIQPGVKAMYNELSSYIHLSGTHFTSLINKEKKLCIGGNNLFENKMLVTAIDLKHQEILQLANKLLVAYLL